MAEVVLYSRPGCHLCDDAREILIEHGVSFTEIDIESSDDLFKRYLERIPVVSVDGVDAFEFHVDPGLLAEIVAPGQATRQR